MTTTYAAPVPATCTCRLSESGCAFFDVVEHEAECDLMDELEARIAGDLMVPSDFDQPGDPVFAIAPDGRFVCHPGVDGDTRCAR